MVTKLYRYRGVILFYILIIVSVVSLNARLNALNANFEQFDTEIALYETLIGNK